MGSGGRVKAWMQVFLDPLSSLEVLIHNGVYLLRMHSAIPGIVRHDMDSWARTTLPHTTTFGHSDSTGLIAAKNFQYFAGLMSLAGTVLANLDQPALRQSSRGMVHRNSKSKAGL
jgi:hypothetical protein